jgi:thiamine transport system substrate-binding protein
MKKFTTLCLATLLSVNLFADDSAKKILTVYTYDSFVSDWGPGPKIKQAFEKDCQCTLNLIAEEDGVSILNRLKIEGKKVKADVILGLDHALMKDAKATGLIADHSQDLSSIKPSLNWQDSAFVPYDFGYFAFIYDSSKITTPATSLKQLIASDASIIYQDPRTSTPGQGLMFWINAVFKGDTNQAWRELAQHTVTVTKGWYEGYSMFLKGGSDYVLSYTTSPAYHMIVESESKYKAAAFSEGHIVQVEVAAALNTSPHPELAQSFLRFLLSDSAKTILQVTNWMLPVTNNTTLPEQFSKLISPKTLEIDIEELSNQRKQWIKDWRTNAVK